MKVNCYKYYYKSKITSFVRNYKLSAYKNNIEGFTLVELMIVIAIIGILAAVAIPNFIAYRDKSYCTSVQSYANDVLSSMADYFSIPSRTQLSPVTINGDGTTTPSSFKKDVKLSSIASPLSRYCMATLIEVIDSKGNRFIIITIT